MESNRPERGGLGSERKENDLALFKFKEARTIGYYDNGQFKVDSDKLMTLCKKAIDKYNIVLDKDGLLWEKVEGCYKERLNRDFLDYIIGAEFLYEEYLKPQLKSIMLEGLKQQARFKFNSLKSFEQNQNYVYFKEQKLNLLTQQLETIEKEDVIFYNVPHKIGTSTLTPKIEKLSRDIFPDKPYTFLKDLLAYFILPTNPNKYIFYFYGARDSGKSTITSILENFVGFHNTTSMQFDLIVNTRERFETINLRNKYLAFISEIEKQTIKTSQLKHLSGNDRVRGEYKGKNGTIHFKTPVKLIILCNDLPQIKNSHDEAYTTRTIIIDFVKQFERVLRAEAIEIDKTEYENLARYAVNKISEWYSPENNKAVISGLDLSLEEQHTKYLMKSNPMVFVISNLFQYSENEDDIIKTEEVYNAIDNYYLEKGQTLTHDFRQLGKEVKKSFELLKWESERVRKRTEQYYNEETNKWETKREYFFTNLKARSVPKSVPILGDGVSRLETPPVPIYNVSCQKSLAKDIERNTGTHRDTSTNIPNKPINANNSKNNAISSNRDNHRDRTENDIILDFIKENDKGDGVHQKDILEHTKLDIVSISKRLQRLTEVGEIFTRGRGKWSLIGVI